MTQQEFADKLNVTDPMVIGKMDYFLLMTHNKKINELLYFKGKIKILI